ncbi:MAG: SDR family oxidoreductase [Taibaiella sp.]|nr:SDR family oxidoreductase [Taibaiella sp.]
MNNLVITGGTKGIGRAIITYFAAQGWNITFCARSADEVQALADDLKRKYPRQSFKGTPVDCAVRSEVLSWSEQVLRELDAIDILVNNAGIYCPGEVSTEADGVLEAQLQVNLMSAYYLTRALLPVMIRRQSAHIFNMCSIASLAAYPGGGSYSISKYALLGFSDNLRLELKDKGIKVTAVLPGATYSDSWSGSGIDPERIMEAEDIAKLVYQCSMLSPQAVVERLVVRPQLGDL